MNEMRKYVRLIEQFEKLNEVRVLSDKEETQPLKDSDSIRVYHGTNSKTLVATWIKKGLTGNTKANRTYSYEFNNNPMGLFVTPDLNTAKYFGTIVIEFNVSVSDLESPVWPSGTFTGQGQMSGVFNSSQEREDERLRNREIHKNSKNDAIRNSDRPELAAILLQGGERQALFTGDLDPNFVKSVWIKDNPEKSTSSFSRYSPKQFLGMIKSDKLSSFYYERGGGNDERNRDKPVKPREYLSGDEFIQRLIKTLPPNLQKNMTAEKIKAIYAKHPESIRDEVWSERQFKHYKKELGFD